MKDKPDLVRAWLKKAASDLVAMSATAQAGSLDTACFHAQQAAEKYLKAYLLDRGQTIPHTHNLYKLVTECSRLDPAFNQLMDTADVLNPFAVEVRYDTEFWPTSAMFEDAEAATNRVAAFVGALVNQVAASAAYDKWKSARNQFNYRVDLQAFDDAEKHPGFFDRIIEPHQVEAFEDMFRSALTSEGYVERAAEVVFWKNGKNHLAKNKITRGLMDWIHGKELWTEFVNAVTGLAQSPSWDSFQKLINACGQTSGFATPLTFLCFYDPLRFPMVDRRIGEWWEVRRPRHTQFKWNKQHTVISPSKQSWEAYMSWAEFCRRQAAELSKFGEMTWRARDVEMAVWADTEARLPLNE